MDLRDEINDGKLTVTAKPAKNLGIVVPTSSTKTLKRCLSVPTIRTLPTSPLCTSATTMTTRAAAAAAAAIAKCNGNISAATDTFLETPKKHTHALQESSTSGSFSNGVHIGIPRSNPSSREVSPAPMFNIFAPRARRYSASYSPLGAASVAATGAGGSPLCLTPRVSQLRQEECADINTREVNHEREVHNVMQMSQSWEDLTLVAENWSCKSDELSNPLQVVLPATAPSCSSPSPTSNRTALRLPPYGLSPSPTRRTFATRRSMSPIAMRPSQLGPVKRKFELDDINSSNWNYSTPPAKKIFTESSISTNKNSRGSSPGCQSPSSVCPSPDSGTYDGRITPKFFISKLCTTNASNSACGSPVSASPSSSVIGGIDSTATSTLCSSSSSSTTSSLMGGSEPMISIDEGISISENDDKQAPINRTQVQPMSTDIQDDITLMDDNKSETSSIGCCSSISFESTSCDSGAKNGASAGAFFNKLLGDDVHISSLSQKNFFINKQGCAKKFIVNHDNLPNSNNEHLDSISSTTSRNSASTDIDGDDALMAPAATSKLGDATQVVAVASVIVENKL